MFWGRQGFRSHATINGSVRPRCFRKRSHKPQTIPHTHTGARALSLSLPHT